MVVGIDEEEDDVDGLHEGPEPIDGGDEEAVGLGEAVVEPQQRVEQRHHVWRRLELLRRPAPHDPPERRAAAMHFIQLKHDMKQRKQMLMVCSYTGEMKTRTEMMFPATTGGEAMSNKENSAS